MYNLCVCHYLCSFESYAVRELKRQEEDDGLTFTLPEQEETEESYSELFKQGSGNNEEAVPFISRLLQACN